MRLSAAITHVTSGSQSHGGGGGEGGVSGDVGGVSVLVYCRPGVTGCSSDGDDG